MTTDNAIATARAYHDAWTGGHFDDAAALLADELLVEVPVNEYPTRDSFVAALTGFGSMTRRVELLSELGGHGEALLLYDMDVEGLGVMRVAEHFTVAAERIVRLRQIHDTAALRAAGFVPPDYTATVFYAAPIVDVYDAVARPGGGNGWWTTSGDTATGPGGLMRLNWSDGDYVVFRLDRLDRPAAMTWTCVEQHDRNLEVPDEWVGTKLHFQFFADREGTRLEFRHEGLVPQLDCFDACEGGWDFFLRRSIKLLAETGAGQPYVAEPGPDALSGALGPDTTGRRAR